MAQATWSITTVTIIKVIKIITMKTIITMNTTRRTFSLGQVVATRGALAAIPPARVLAGLARHARGDWGCVCQMDAVRNDRALVDQERILSAYPIDPAKPAKGYGANVFWIITEADRSVTTFLLPEEY